MARDIPEFQSLEEERAYWEERGPLADGHRGRVSKANPHIPVLCHACSWYGVAGDLNDRACPKCGSDNVERNLKGD